MRNINRIVPVYLIVFGIFITATSGETIDTQINNSVDVRPKFFITHGCYGPHDKLKPFFDSLSLKHEFQKEVDAFAEKHFRNKKVIGADLRYYSKYMPESGRTGYWRDQAEALGTCIDKIKKASAGFKDSEKVVPVNRLPSGTRFRQPHGR
jgi:hypothetical protein